MVDTDGRATERRAAAIALVVAVVVLAVSMLIVRSGKVSQPEKDVFHGINGLPDFLRDSRHHAPARDVVTRPEIA